MHDQMNTDLYAVLGIAPDATASEISKRYKALARELHPDVSTEEGAEDRFKEVTAAYDVLGDEDKRAEYDQFRSMVGGGFSDGSFTGFGSDGGFRGGSGGLDDLIGQMFAQQASAPRRGADLRASARIDFADAVRGTTLTFDGPGGSSPRRCQRPSSRGRPSLSLGPVPPERMGGRRVIYSSMSPWLQMPASVVAN